VPVLDAAPETVAIVRPRTGIGDLLCHLPALRALRARLPRAHVAFVSFPAAAWVADRQADVIDEFVAFPGHPGIDERPADLPAFEPFLAAMRARRFDLAIQLHSGNPAVNLVTDRIGAARTAGFFATGAWDVDLDAFLPYPLHLHEVRRLLALAAHLGAPAVGEQLAFPVRPADTAQAAALALDAPYALLHPGASAPSRRWPADRFAAVGDALAAEGLTVAVTGTSAEAAVTGAVVGAMRAPARDLTGALDLGGTAALLRGAALLVTNDTGPAHLAAALGTPSVTVFTADSPHRWAHDRRRHRIAHHQVECSPCGHVVCPIDHRCARRVTVAAVLAAGLDLLGERAGVVDVTGHLVDERLD
jgi:ADP-heptose:LPS heptosyltransferase